MAKIVPEYSFGSWSKTYYIITYVLFVFFSLMQSLDKQSRKKLLAILDNFRAELKTVHHFEDIFDRSSDADCRICDEEGWFHCEGPYNENSCRKYHTINPYATRDCRVFFKTWNLDHR